MTVFRIASLTGPSRLFLFCAVLMTAATMALAADADDVVKNMQKTYRKANTMQIEFQEVTRFKFTGTESSVSGTLVMAGKDRFRFTTEDQILVSDGKTLWRFNKIENQILVDEAREGEQDEFLNTFLIELKDHYYSQLVEEYKADGKTIFVLKLTPKPSEQSPFTDIRVWVEDDTWRVRKLVYTRYNGDETEYRIDTLAFNPEIPDSVFALTPPEGTRVIDLRF